MRPWPLSTLLLLLLPALCHPQQVSYPQQSSLDRALFDPDRAQIPAHILRCYQDRTMWNRYTRMPMSVHDLVAIIRKVELHPRVRGWTPGRVSSALLHAYRFDGITYDKCVDTSTGALPFKIDMQAEFPKMSLVFQLISGHADDLPEDILTEKEKCSLHWMLSYAVNTTFREDEVYWSQEYNSGAAHSASVPHSHPPASQLAVRPDPEPHLNALRPRPPYERHDCEDTKTESKSPWEMGVVWSESGPVAAGTMLAGLAAGLMPQSVSWPSGNVINGWAASLAGDLGQTAVLKIKDKPYVGPDGYFNSTICPAEFYLRTEAALGPMFSHLTVSEINGGLDGLLLSESAVWWERHSGLLLSHILEGYYSTLGTPTLAGGAAPLQACHRYSMYFTSVDMTRLVDQAFVFGNELKKLLLITIDESSLRTAIGRAREQLDRLIIGLDASYDLVGACAEQRKKQITQQKGSENLDGKQAVEANRDAIDRVGPSSGAADIALILDSSIYAYEDELYQRQVVAALSNELDIWLTTFIDDVTRATLNASGGSLLEVSDGRFGNVLVASSNVQSVPFPEPYYNNKAVLACRLVDEEFPHSGDLDPHTTVERAAARIAGRVEERTQQGNGWGRSRVVLLVSFGRIATGDTDAFYEAAYRLRRDYPSSKLLVVTRWAPASDFAKYVDFPERDVIALGQYDGEARAERDARIIAARLAQIPAPLAYTDCIDHNGNPKPESLVREYVQVLPGTQRFLVIHPRYFLNSKWLKLFLRVENNALTACWSRYSPEEHASGAAPDKEQCRSASNKGTVTFEWTGPPCEGKSLSSCRPIHLRLEFEGSGVTADCLTEDKFPCRSASAALIEISHEGMKCGASVNSLTLFVLLTTFAFSLYTSSNLQR